MIRPARGDLSPSGAPERFGQDLPCGTICNSDRLLGSEPMAQAPVDSARP